MAFFKATQIPFSKLASSRNWRCFGQPLTSSFKSQPCLTLNYHVVLRRSCPLNSNRCHLTPDSPSALTSSSKSNNVLNYNVQNLLIRLLDLTQPNELNISIKRGKLLIQKPGFLKDLVPLHNFIRYSLELFDQLMLISTEGLNFLNENNATILESITCPICSGRITEQMVLCERCKTPHCRDCWEYNRQCATFACQGTILSCDYRSLSGRKTQLHSQLLHLLSSGAEMSYNYLARIYRGAKMRNESRSTRLRLPAWTLTKATHAITDRTPVFF